MATKQYHKVENKKKIIFDKGERAKQNSRRRDVYKSS